MDFRVMDEAVEFEGRGLALIVNEGDSDTFMDGCLIRDIQGKTHTVTKVSKQEDLTILFIEGGDVDYFGRLLRNIRLDATLFTLLPLSDSHGA